MSVTYGFYNSLDGDRKYDAIQMSSIFDGIIEDGILQQIGTAMVVKAADTPDLSINVGIGRAWFNHTWTLNDAVLPLPISTPEVLLSRYDAVVLEVDASEAVRANSIKIISGTAATSPSKPELTNTTEVHQYPLAYIYVGAGVTEIRQADIENCVGTSACPYVTAPLESVSIDDLFAQWKDQWNVWFENQGAAIQKSYADWQAEWELFYATISGQMNTAQTDFQSAWESWFSSYTTNYTSEMTSWKDTEKTAFDTWFASLQDTLSGDVAANLAQQILELQNRATILETFDANLTDEQTIYTDIYDTLESSTAIQDSSGNTIQGRTIFVIK